MQSKLKGTLAAVLSAAIFGFTPIIARLSYDGGSNAFMLTFLRSFMALPFLYLLLKIGRISLALTRLNIRQIIALSVFGTATSTLTLYASYSYIPVGMATLIHFTFPSLVVLYCVLFLQEKMTAYKLACLILSILGLLLFCDLLSESRRPQMTGIVLAVISAVTYAFVIVYQTRSSLIYFHPLKISFVQCFATAVIMLIAGGAANSLTLGLTAQAWLYSLIVAIFISVLALSLFQYSLQYIGATPSSVLSLIEPITGVAAGILILNEDFTPPKLLGCVMIVLAVFIFSLGEAKSDLAKS